MLKGLYTAYTGMINEQNRMDVLTNNLANASTIGFKKEGATSQAFDDVLALKIKDTSESPNCAKRLGTMSMGVKIGENYTDYSQGSFRETGNTYDLAIAGNGFFAIEFTNKAGETSTKYTRDGSFTLNQEGYLVTEDGDYVLDEDGDQIKLNPLLDSVIDAAGNIYQGNTIVATIGITDFEDYNYLEKYGENLYQTVDGATEREATAQIRSGYLEMANLQVVSEMVNMIAITRAYETNQKIIQTYDGSLDIAVNQLGKLG
ncbi:MAG: flagellar hook-basal body protein [Lachnospiraceae bacterium]|nr:flagellar hook-basal body protein [Lachnospiraceae bacterium]